MKKFYGKMIIRICRGSFRHPWWWLAVAILITIPAVMEFSRVGLDTDLIRLLPEDSKAYQMKHQVDQLASSSGGFFAILLESQDKEKLLQAFHASVAEVETLDGIGSLEYRNPADFFKNFRYVLVPSEFLDRILDFFVRLEAKVNPMGTDLLSDEEENEEPAGQRGEKPGNQSQKEKEEQEKEDIKKMMRYLDLPDYHQSEDGKVMAIKIYPQKGTTSLGKMKRLFVRLEAIAKKVSREHGVWAGVGGSWRNSIDQFDFIMSDLGRSGTITFILVFLCLVIGFRSILILPVLLLPLLLGLAWTMGAIPFLVGDLNTITSFLLMVSFGLGIDFSIHLVKRFQNELKEKGVEEALIVTFHSTGISIIVSGLTTALALFILAFSSFRGFSEFGIVGGFSIIAILIAMILFLPAFCVLGLRLKLLRKIPTHRQSGFKIPSRVFTYIVIGLVGVSLVLAVIGIRFNYDFSDMDVKVAQEKEIKTRYYKVYESVRSPGALFIVNGLEQLDRLDALLKARVEDENSHIQKYHTLRELCPGPAEFQKRLSLIDEIKDAIAGRWVNRVEDQDYKKWIDDMRAWVPPDRGPRLEELPGNIRDRFSSKKREEHYIIPVYIKGDKQKGRNAMAFTSELNSLAVPGGTIGPFGETTVLADVLTIVTHEGPWLVLITFLGIFLLIWLNQRQWRHTLWIMMPLVASTVLTAGIMVVSGLSLNFFNIVVFPTLLGMGVDYGVHYYRRWLELEKNTVETQRELFVPLLLTSLTTIFGYIGIVFSSHPGLQSIGILASIGMTSVWFITLYMLPGILEMTKEKAAKKL